MLEHLNLQATFSFFISDRYSSFLLISIFIYFLLSFFWSLFCKKKQELKNSLNFFKWLVFIFLINILARLIGIIFKDKILLIINILSLWFLIKNFNKGFLKEFYFPNVRKINVKSIYFDLLNISFFIILFIVFLREVLNIELSSILTSSAILTGIIGLSMQDTIGNLISGLLIQIEKPFDIGEWIKVKDLEGMVVEISWRYTKIQTINFDYILIPNNSISKDTLINYSRPISKTFRKLYVGVDLSVSPIKVKSTILDILNKIEGISSNPRPRVFLSSYEDYKIIYRISYYVDRLEKHRQIQDQVLSSLWYAFKQKNIQLSLPKQKVSLERKTEAKKVDVDSSLIEIIKNSKLFKEFSSLEVKELLELTEQKNYLAGEYILRKGEKSTEMYFIIKGKVEIRKDSKQIAKLEAGDFFGEMSLLTNLPRTADVVALEDTFCLIIDKEFFNSTLSHNKKFLNNVRQIFEQRKDSLKEKDVPIKDKDNLWSILKNMFK